MSKRSFKFRFLAILLTACLTVSLTSVFSYSNSVDLSARIKSENENIVSENTISNNNRASVNIGGLKYIDQKDLGKLGVIRRLTEKETLNSYAFLNFDGTESIVVFPENIKYVSESGEIVEKDTSLVRLDRGGYTVRCTDYSVLFPDDICNGLYFKYLNGSIILKPIDYSGKPALEDNTVVYSGIFGNDTELRYTPLLNGIKEDIIIGKYSGVNEFKFRITTDGVDLSVKDNEVFFVNDVGEPTICFSDILAYDNEGKMVKGSISVLQLEGTSEYSLVVSVPMEFLEDPKTVYPVTIDPTIQESSDGSAIQDAPVFDSSAYQNMNCGSFIYDSIGATSLGTARTAVWLYGLETHPIYKTLDAEEIVSVKLSVKEATGNATKYVNLYRISSAVTWTESTVTYNNVGSFNTSVNKGDYLSSGERTEFDITSFAKGWKNQSYTNTMRVIFTMSGGESSSLKQFHSSEAAVPGNRPYIIFTYQIKNLMDEGIYYIRNKHIDRYLQPNGGSSSINTGLILNDFTGGNAQKWEVISLGNGYYTIKSVLSNYVLSVPSGSYSTYDVQLIQTTDSQADGQQWRIYMTSYCGFAIKPKSACGSGDGTGWSDRTMSVADGNDGNGALVTQRPYVYNNSFKDEWYLVPVDISESVDYEIQNRQLGTYVQSAGGSVDLNDSLELYTQSYGTSQRWNFTKIGGGYYKVSPYGYSSYAVSIASGDENAENGSVLLQSYSSGNARQQWFVYKVPNGYVLKARSSGLNNLVLSVSEGNLGNGAIVSQRAYVNNNSYKEEWYLRRPGLEELDDGVYYIGIGSVFCTVSQANSNPGASVVVKSLYSYSASLAEQASQMWKIKKLGNGRYSVRPLHKLDMGMIAYYPYIPYYGNTTISQIGTNDVPSMVPDLAEWMIEKIGDKYVLKPQGYENYAVTASGTTSDSTVYTSLYTSGNANQRWTFTLVPPANVPKGIVLYRQSDGAAVSALDAFIEPDGNLTLAQADIKVGVVDITNLSQSVTWSVAPADSEYLSVNYATGEVHEIQYKSTGSSVICSRFIPYATYSNCYTINHSLIANGEYYLCNKQNKVAAKVLNDTLQDNQCAVQFETTVSDYQRWVLELNPRSGNYTIKTSASDNTNYYLQVYQNSTECNANIVIKSYLGGDFPSGMQWKIESATNGAYKIIPLTGENLGYVLATGSSDSSNNINLIQGLYVNNNSYRDEWYIVKPNTSMLIAKEEPSEPNKSFYFAATSSKLRTYRRGSLTAVITDDFESISEQTVINYLKSYNVFVECSHGEKTFFRINGEHNSPPFDGDKIFAGQLGYYNIDNIDFLYLMSCESGVDYVEGGASTLCLVNGAINGGAKCVVGFSDVIDRNDANGFLQYLLRKCIEEGKTVGQAFNEFVITQVLFSFQDCYGNEYSGLEFKDIIVIAGDLSYDFSVN